MNTPFCGYTLLREIRRGGMGIVWLAEDATGQQVAVKVLLEKYRHNAEVRSRFEVEPEHQLAHAHIPQVLQADECNGLPFFAMTFVDGESLEDKLNAAPHGLGWGELHPILSQIATALDHIHTHGLVHRDVKPDNILIRAHDGKAYLIDFGIAKKAGRMALTGTDHEPFGTHAYMAPEQCQKPIRSLPASDVYALAVTAYQALTGALPFQASTDDDFKRMHLQQPPPDIRRVKPEIPKPAAVLLQRALAKDPDQRFRTPTDFVVQLHAAMQIVAAPGAGHAKVWAVLAGLFAVVAVGLGLASGIRLPFAAVPGEAVPTAQLTQPAVAPSVANTLAAMAIATTPTTQATASDPTTIPTLVAPATDAAIVATDVTTPAPSQSLTPGPTRNATTENTVAGPVQLLNVGAGGERWYQPDGWPTAEVCKVLKQPKTVGTSGVYFNFTLQVKHASPQPIDLGVAELAFNKNLFRFSCVVNGNPQQVPRVTSGTPPRITIGMWIETIAPNDVISIRFRNVPRQRYCARLVKFENNNAVFTKPELC